MPDDRAPWESSATGQFDPSAQELSELRELILGPERRRARERARRLVAGATPEELAELLPKAIALRAGRDRQLARALAPTVERAISESVRRNPREIASAIFPVLGPAIRKAIAETLAGLVASINSKIEDSLSPRGLRWRVEAWRTGVPYAQIVLKHALVYRVEQVFLIHAETGLLLSHAWAPDLAASDPDLISGMLTAIRDFVADSFSPERDAGGLRQFSVGELTVMVEQGPRAMIAAVVRGQAPDTLLTKLQDTVETIHLQFFAPLADFDGDTSPLAGVRPLLEECLATVVATGRERTGRRAVWLTWAIAALLVILVVGGIAWRSHQRWSRAVAQLRSEPGIVLVRAERSGRWSFTGLRDPMAADPSTLLATAGVDTAAVEQHWERYLSLQPQLVLARARAALSPPAGVTLALAGDTLRLRGSASLRWFATTARTAGLPPGVAVLDLSRVTPDIPHELAGRVADVERERILFGVGSAALDSPARAALTRVAAALVRVQTAAAVLGANATIELAGRTDPTGTDATNQTLSRERAETVLAALAERGTSPADVRVSALGTTQPVAQGNPALNRSVSFTVSLR